MRTFNIALAIFALLPLLIGSTGCQKDQKSSSSVALSSQRRFEAISPQSRQDLHRYFLAYEYNWNTVKHGVPPLIVEKFPDDFSELTAGSERTRTFFLTLLPLALLVNEEIATERNALLELFSRYDHHELLGADEIAQVAASARNYKVTNDPLIDRRARILLLNRLDQIPPSLALAQAACESAYGTSRFSRLGNNLFGELVFTNGATGIIPLNREKYCARIFPSLLASFRAYMLNLNTHPAYQELRQIRAEMQMRGEKVQGLELTRGLLLYSTRKEAYIADIRAIIRANNLHKFTANATLRKEYENHNGKLKNLLPLPAEYIPPQASRHNLFSQN